MLGMNGSNGVNSTAPIHDVTSATAMHMQVNETRQHDAFLLTGGSVRETLDRDNGVHESNASAHPAVWGEDASGKMRRSTHESAT